MSTTTAKRVAAPTAPERKIVELDVTDITLCDDNAPMYMCEVLDNCVIFVVARESAPYYTTREKDGKPVEGKNIVFSTSHGILKTDETLNGEPISVSFTAMIPRSDAPKNGNGKKVKHVVKL